MNSILTISGTLRKSRIRFRVLIPLLLFMITCIPFSLNAQLSADGSVCRHTKNQLHGNVTLSANKLPAGYEISHYGIHIDSLSWASFTLTGRTEVTVVSTQVSLTEFDLSLLQFNIDSITSSGQLLTYNYNDTILSITLSAALNVNDSAKVMVHYNGNPKLDASGWGGFYFTGNYAFNLGVGFSADPHNFGRAWFPCVDDFVSRSRYDFYITTPAGLKAFCNGTLLSQMTNPSGSVTWHWKLEETIPSYLASMAVGNYVTMDKTYSGIPVQFASLAADTNKINSTFSNLDTTLSSFIDAYGPYPFPKVGYCLIPFNSGAMEHASSIHIGRAFVNGSQTYATLWAHELAHMWWGDKVTCETAEDMWLNEGWASFNEALYNEIVSGKTAYTNWIRSNHRSVTQFAHTPAQDNSYLTLNNIPHEYTYGAHVYSKGASIAHTLRSYMGDSAFFEGCKYYLNNRAFDHASSYDLRDDMTSGSGVDVTRFFDDWVFTPGFPHFSIDSVYIYSGAFDHVYVHTRQRTKGNNHIYEMPVELNLTDGINDTTISVVIDSVTNMFHIPLLFIPTWVSLDRGLKITDAIVDFEKEISTTGSHIMYETNVSLSVADAGSNPSDVRIEHNFVQPDGFMQSNPGIRLSDYRYWKVDGILSSGFQSSANFTYDGSTSSASGFLDNNLITGTEDSLVMMFREGTWDDWQMVNGFTLNTGGTPNDKRGSIIVDTLKKGEYTLGYHDFTVSVIENETESKVVLEAFPNPSTGIVEFRINMDRNGPFFLEIFDSGGRLVHSASLEKSDNSYQWNAEEASKGIYFANLYGRKRLLSSKKVMIQ